MKIQRQVLITERKLAKVEAVAVTETALVLHKQNVQKSALEESGVKLHAGRKRQQRKEFNAAAWQKGKKDSKEIDLDQRALKNL